MKVGILALQGSFAEHGHVLKRLEVDFIWVRTLEELESVSHLIIPGGESTTMVKLLKMFDMWEVLKSRLESDDLKLFGTCAGAILCQYLGMDIEVERNAYGAQQGSFVGTLESEFFSEIPGTFIRAPKFSHHGASVKVLASHQDQPVLLEDGPFLAATFHPELTEENRIHKYFLNA